ncbi:MAG TPA: biotin/lipoyl-binding protein [Phycisphaerae bacterium]|nr:biotin/lipoyl-binding protein [Phycisphaerae bacterium]
MSAIEHDPAVSASPSVPLGGTPVKIRRKPPTKRRRWVRRAILLTMLGAAAAAAAVYHQPLYTLAKTYFSPAKPQTEGVQLFTAKRGPLRVTMTEQGRLEALKNNLIMLEVNGKITWLQEAGAKVKTGDTLVKIDTKEYDDQKRRLQGDLETAQQQLVAAQQALPMAETKGKSDVAAAVTKKEQAALALKLYTTLDVPKKLAEFETQINDGRTKLQDATKKQQDDQAALDDEVMQDDDAKKAAEDALALQKQTVGSLQKVIANIEDQRKLFRAYNYPQDLKDKQQALANAELDVTRADVTAKGDVLQKQADLSKAKATIDRLQIEMKRLDEEIAKCTVCSPADGLVYYGSPDLDRYGDMSSQIHVGADWYSNYPIMTIPDLSGFQVNFSIAEVYRSRLAEGAPASVTIDAVPGLTMTGKLTTISRVSRGRISWDSTSPQVFDAKLTLDKWDGRLVPGMTVQVEMTTANLPDTLYVPVESVFNDNGATVVYVKHPAGAGDPAHPDLPEKRPVAPGISNDHFVAITLGLKEGEQVLLAQPPSSYTAADYKQRLTEVAAATRAAAAATANATKPSTAASTAPTPAAMPATAPNPATAPQ